MADDDRCKAFEKAMNRIVETSPPKRRVTMRSIVDANLERINDYRSEHDIDMDVIARQLGETYGRTFNPRSFRTTVSAARKRKSETPNVPSPMPDSPTSWAAQVNHIGADQADGVGPDLLNGTQRTSATPNAIRSSNTTTAPQHPRSRPTSIDSIEPDTEV